MTIAPRLQDDKPSDPGLDGDAVLRRSMASDVDQHVDQIPGWDFRYEQLDCGRFDGRFVDIRWPGVQLFVESTTRRVRQRGHLMSDSFGVACMIEGQGEIAVNAVRAGRDAMLMCDSTEIDMCTPAECTLAGIVIDSHLVYEAADKAGLKITVDPSCLVSITPPVASVRRWREVLTGATSLLVDRPALLQDLAVRDRLQHDLVAALVDAIGGGCPDEQAFGVDQRKRLVDRACEMLLSRPEDPPSLAEVCHRIGASPRKLEYCFRDVLGLSPAKYVKSVRLNAVRRELAYAKDPSLSVYDVAARWGFWHFGHFSTDYKKQFAELPSETLRRARFA